MSWMDVEKYTSLELVEHRVKKQPPAAQQDNPIAALPQPCCVVSDSLVLYETMNVKTGRRGGFVLSGVRNLILVGLLSIIGLYVYYAVDSLASMNERYAVDSLVLSMNARSETDESAAVLPLPQKEEQHNDNNSNTNTKHGSPPCRGFFTVLSNAWIPAESGNCTRVYQKFAEQFETHNNHMKQMDNSILTIFTSWSSTELQEPGCNLAKYSNIKTIQFDPEQLLTRQGFTSQQISWMKSWGTMDDVRFNHLVTRLSDIFRLVLAKEYSLAYADLDLLYLSTHKEMYLNVPNVAVPIWSEEKGAFEIQNSGWCFSPSQLEVAVNYIKQLINSKGETQIKRNSYIYTAFGPNLFQHTIQAMQAVDELRFYYTNCDEDVSVEKIEGKHTYYGKSFVWTHLDRNVRRHFWHKNKKKPYSYHIDQIRQLMIPPTLEDMGIPLYDK